MPLDASEVANVLTQPQLQCILDLSEEWKSSGYSKVDADLLWALGDSKLYGKIPALVDCDFHRQENVSSVYRHKLLPLGIRVKEHILKK